MAPPNRLRVTVLVRIAPPPPQMSSLRLAPNLVEMVFSSSSFIFLPSSIACFTTAASRSTTIAPDGDAVKHHTAATATTPLILHTRAIIGMPLSQLVRISTVGLVHSKKSPPPL